MVVIIYSKHAGFTLSTIAVGIGEACSFHPPTLTFKSRMQNYANQTARAF